jgi:hypothetical protein
MNSQLTIFHQAFITMEELKYPIGRFTAPQDVNPNHLKEWTAILQNFPFELIKAVENLTANELHWKYRPDGWTIKQVVHHCADSHINSLIRFKLTLTENLPTIKPYFEAKWAELPDYKDDNLSASIQILKGVHTKLCQTIESLTPNQLLLEFNHPEYNRKYNLYQTAALYAWHSNHHLAHIKNAISSQGKYN